MIPSDTMQRFDVRPSRPAPSLAEVARRNAEVQSARLISQFVRAGVEITPPGPTVWPDQRRVLPVEIGGRLRDERLRAGYTQRRLSREVQVSCYPRRLSVAMIAMLELGQRAPSISTTESLARVLPRMPEELLLALLAHTVVKGHVVPARRVAGPVAAFLFLHETGSTAPAYRMVGRTIYLERPRGANGIESVRRRARTLLETAGIDARSIPFGGIAVEHAQLAEGQIPQPQPFDRLWRNEVESREPWRFDRGSLCSKLELRGRFTYPRASGAHPPRRGWPAWEVSAGWPPTSLYRPSAQQNDRQPIVSQLWLHRAMLRKVVDDEIERMSRLLEVLCEQYERGLCAGERDECLLNRLLIVEYEIGCLRALAGVDVSAL